MGPYKRFVPALSTIFLFACTGIASADHVGAGDNNIHFLINGVEVKSALASASQGYLDITGTYGQITISQQTPTCSSGSPCPARIAWDDRLGGNPSLWLRNAKITTSAPITNLRFTFWRKFVNVPSASATFWAKDGGYMRRGGNAANGAKLVYRGFLERPVSAPNVTIAGLTLPPATVSCTADALVKCVTSSVPLAAGTFYWDPGVNQQLLSSTPAVLTGEFWLTLTQAGDNLQLPDGGTAGMVVKQAPAAGPGSDECEKCEGVDCCTCPDKGCPTKRSFSCILCMTTKSTTPSLKCPSCNPDGTVKKGEEARMFARVNWELLSENLAQGRGEYLSSLATLLLVQDTDKEDFYRAAQDVYLSSAEQQCLNPDAMLSALRDIMARKQGMLAGLP